MYTDAQGLSSSSKLSSLNIWEMFAVLLHAYTHIYMHEMFSSWSAYFNLFKRNLRAVQRHESLASHYVWTEMICKPRHQCNKQLGIRWILCPNATKYETCTRKIYGILITGAASIWSWTHSTRFLVHTQRTHCAAILWRHRAICIHFLL